MSITSSPPLVTLTCFCSTPNEKGIAFTQILIISVTLVVVAVHRIRLAKVDPTMKMSTMIMSADGVDPSPRMVNIVVERHRMSW